jgi:apolipoprotein N-acyltransferase
MAVGVIPESLIALFVVVGSAAFAAIVTLSRHVVRRLDGWLAAFAFPILWTAWEHLNSANGSSASIAYSQLDWPAAIQIAAVTGFFGVTFLVSLVPSAVAVAWWLRRRPRQRTLALAVPLGLCAVVLGWGAVRASRPAPGPRVRVGLAATDETVRFFRTERREEALAVVAAYARRVARLAAGGAQVVVLPESSSASRRSMPRRFATRSRRRRARIACGWWPG